MSRMEDISTFNAVREAGLGGVAQALDPEAREEILMGVAPARDIARKPLELYKSALDAFADGIATSAAADSRTLPEMRWTKWWRPASRPWPSQPRRGGLQSVFRS